MGTDHLRKGRRSIPYARYFITICTNARKPLLDSTSGIEAVRQALRQIHIERDINLNCGTVMPDHCHLLFTLGNRLTLSQSISKLKRQVRKGLNQKDIWQDNYYDHRIRPEQELEPFAKYIFLNPYRKGLIPCEQTWPGWIRNKGYHPEFLAHLIEGKFPPKEWIANAMSCSELIEEHS